MVPSLEEPKPAVATRRQLLVVDVPIEAGAEYPDVERETAGTSARIRLRDGWPRRASPGRRRGDRIHGRRVGATHDAGQPERSREGQPEMALHGHDAMG